jgi:hypothetical protein
MMASEMSDVKQDIILWYVVYTMKPTYILENTIIMMERPSERDGMLLVNKQ